MSISNLFTPNSYELFTKFLTINANGVNNPQICLQPVVDGPRSFIITPIDALLDTYYRFPNQAGGTFYVSGADAPGINWPTGSPAIGDVAVYNGSNMIWAPNASPFIWSGNNLTFMSDSLGNSVEVSGLTNNGSQILTLATQGNITCGGQLIINSQTYTFPPSQSPNTYLKTDGAGNLSWATATSLPANAPGYLNNDGFGVLTWQNIPLPISLTANTLNNTPTPIYTLNTAPDTSYMLEINIILHNVTANSGGLMKFLYKVEQGAALSSPVVAGPLNSFFNLDASNSLCNVSSSVAADQFVLNVVGNADNLNWKAQINNLNQN